MELDASRAAHAETQAALSALRAADSEARAEAATLRGAARDHANELGALRAEVAARDAALTPALAEAAQLRARQGNAPLAESAAAVAVAKAGQAAAAVAAAALGSAHVVDHYVGPGGGGGGGPGGSGGGRPGGTAARRDPALQPWSDPSLAGAHTAPRDASDALRKITSLQHELLKPAGHTPTHTGQHTRTPRLPSPSPPPPVAPHRTAHTTPSLKAAASRSGGASGGGPSGLHARPTVSSQARTSGNGLAHAAAHGAAAHGHGRRGRSPLSDRGRSPLHERAARAAATPWVTRYERAEAAAEAAEAAAAAAEAAAAEAAAAEAEAAAAAAGRGTARRLRLEQLGKEMRCPICFDLFDRPHSLPCQHSFCYECVMGCFRATSKMECPLCKAPTWRRQVTTNHTLAGIVQAFAALQEQADSPVRGAAHATAASPAASRASPASTASPTF